MEHLGRFSLFILSQALLSLSKDFDHLTAFLRCVKKYLQLILIKRIQLLYKNKGRIEWI